MESEDLASDAVAAPQQDGPGDCQVLGDRVEVTSIEQFETALVGTWIRCDGDLLPGRDVDQVGIDVTADGQFYRGYRLPDGTLARATGPEQQGNRVVIGTTEINGPGAYQVDWNMTGGGVAPNFPQFYDSTSDAIQPFGLHFSGTPNGAEFENVGPEHRRRAVRRRRPSPRRRPPSLLRGRCRRPGGTRPSLVIVAGTRRRNQSAGSG